MIDEKLPFCHIIIFGIKIVTRIMNMKCLKSILESGLMLCHGGMRNNILRVAIMFNNQKRKEPLTESRH